MQHPFHTCGYALKPSSLYQRFFMTSCWHVLGYDTFSVWRIASVPCTTSRFLLFVQHSPEVQNTKQQQQALGLRQQPSAQAPMLSEALRTAVKPSSAAQAAPASAQTHHRTVAAGQAAECAATFPCPWPQQRIVGLVRHAASAAARTAATGTQGFQHMLWPVMLLQLWA